MVCKLTMHAIGFFNVSLMRVVSTLKKTEIIIFAVVSYMRLPFFSANVPRNTFKPRLICDWPLDVVHILITVCQPKISYPVVISDAVNVINFLVWPLTKINRPSSSVRSNQNIIYSDDYVSRAVKAGYLLANPTLSPVHPPKQVSSFRIVGQQLFKSFCAWFHGNMVTCKFNNGKF